MESQPDPLTLILTGQLPFVVIIAPLLALPVAWLLLKLYRRAVLRTMSKPTIGAGSTNVSDTPSFAPPVAMAPQEVINRVQQFSRSRLLEQLIAGFIYGLCITIFWLWSTKMEMLWTRLLMLTLIHSWPGWLISMLQLGPSGTRKRRLLILYVVSFASLAALVLSRSPDSSVWQLLLLWGMNNAPATVLVMLFLNRRIRAVGPMVLALMICCVGGAVVLLAIFAQWEAGLRGLVTAGVALGMKATGMFVAIILGGFLLFGVVGWFLLGAIAKAYQKKRISDLSITNDAIMLLFAFSHSVGLVFEEAVWIVSGPVAFVVWKLVLRARDRFRRLKEIAVRLLLLRVFALGKRSEALFDRLSGYWRELGPIQLIAGPDLVTTTIEPHEMLGFASGRLERQFCHSDAEVQERVGMLDLVADRDGRFRINEFFCHDTTWRLALANLLSVSHVVLMDLRSFSLENSGCLYEIRALLHFVPLERLVLLTDETTNHQFLNSTLAEEVEKLPSDSPNVGKKPPTLLNLKALDERDFRQLLEALAHACARG